MIEFGLSEDLQMVQDAAGQIGKDLLAEQARAAESAGSVPDEVRNTLTEFGLAGIDLPEDQGGAGLGMTGLTTGLIALANGDPALALATPHPGAAGWLLRALDAEKAAPHLEPFLAGKATTSALITGSFCEAGGVDGLWLKVEKGRIAGTTGPVLHGEGADLTVAIVNDDGTMKAFVLPATGMEAKKVESCGLNVLPLSRLTVDIAVADADLVGTGEEVEKALATALGKARLAAASAIAGAARAGNDYAIAYAQERSAFGQKIARFQGLAFMIADDNIGVEAIEAIIQRAAWEIDTGAAQGLQRANEAILQASELGDKIATDSLQTLGGNGFVEDYPVEKWMRDIKQLGVLWGSRAVYQLAAQPDDLTSWNQDW